MHRDVVARLNLPQAVATVARAMARSPVGRADDVVRTGCRSLDGLFPQGGLQPGSLIEWLADDPAAGALSLACAVAATLVRRRAETGAETGAVAREIVVVDRRGWLHPPAIMPWLEPVADLGRAKPSRLYVARPANDADEIWAIDQALRCRGVAVVVAWPGWPRGLAVGSQAASSGESIHATVSRRWQLAARGSGAVGMLVRPSRTARETSWADARISVQPADRSTSQRLSSRAGWVDGRRLLLTRFGGGWIGNESASAPVAEVELDLVRGRLQPTMGRRAARPCLHVDRRGECRAS
jgi:hypothetical protein